MKVQKLIKLWIIYSSSHLMIYIYLWLKIKINYKTNVWIFLKSIIIHIIIWSIKSVISIISIKLYMLSAENVEINYWDILLY